MIRYVHVQAFGRFTLPALAAAFAFASFTGRAGEPTPVPAALPANAPAATVPATAPAEVVASTAHRGAGKTEVIERIAAVVNAEVVLYSELKDRSAQMGQAINDDAPADVKPCSKSAALN